MPFEVRVLKLVVGPV